MKRTATVLAPIAMTRVLTPEGVVLPRGSVQHGSTKVLRTSKAGRIGLPSMIALVAGAMIGGALFRLPGAAAGCSLAALLLSWLVTGAGMAALAFVLRTLSTQRPDLQIGIYSYAKAGFGRYAGFNSAWGYWLAAAGGNVAFALMINDALGVHYPALLNHGLETVLLCTGLVWFFNFVVMRGVRTASAINLVALVLKVVGIIVILVTLAGFFRIDLSAFTSQAACLGKGPLFEQLRAPMLVSLWCFIGIEGAVVMSDHASEPGDVGRATLSGFFVAITAYALLSLLAFGIHHQPGAVTAAGPMPISTTVGADFAGFVNAAMILSVAGSWLAWTVLIAQLPFAAAVDGVMPGVFARVNKGAVPSRSLFASSVLMTMLVVLCAGSKDLHTAAVTLTGVLIVPCYLAASLFLCKVAPTSAIYTLDDMKRYGALALGVFSSINALWLLWLVGLKNLLPASVLYALGIVVFIAGRHETMKPGEKAFTRKEVFFALAVAAAAVYSIYRFLEGYAGF